METTTIEITKRRELIKNIIGLINNDMICYYETAKSHFPITFGIVMKMSSSEIRFLAKKIIALKG